MPVVASRESQMDFILVDWVARVSLLGWGVLVFGSSERPKWCLIWLSAR